MTPSQFDFILRGFCRRRPFQPFILEFVSSAQLVVLHPEAIGPKGGIYVLRRPDGGYVAFASESVSRVLDIPPATAT